MDGGSPAPVRSRYLRLWLSSPGRAAFDFCRSVIVSRRMSVETESEGSTAPEFFDTRDPFLVAYLNQAVTRKTPLAIIVGGTVISGWYLDNSAFADLLASNARKQLGLPSEPQPGDGEGGDEIVQGSEDPDFLHLYDCRVFGQNNGNFGLETLRIRIMDIQGWMPGLVQ